uniref:G_PROTEIN_RECEP_F1_2 domain-containing protein n=1 Tax=Globodera pallida TaxID=36090 RepID=A0A183C3L5_GLOPA
MDCAPERVHSGFDYFQYFAHCGHIRYAEHKVCNWLIAYDSLCQLFVVAPFGVNLLAVLFQISPLDYRICLGTLMASTVASYASILAIYLISIERLLIILYPIKMNWHKKSAVRRCSLIAVILCTLFGLIMNLKVFDIWTIINLPYDRFIYCNSGLYSDVLNTTTAYFQHSPESDDYYNVHLIYIEKLGYFSEIAPWIVLPNVFTPVSIIFNISLIVVTFATLKEHKVCNWLIAYDSLCQLFVVVPFGVNLLAVLFQISPLDYRICLGTLMASTVASYASILAIYLISIERLLIILYPIKMNWHKKSAIRRCSLIAVILCTLFGLIMNLKVFGIWTIINLPYDRFIYCNSGLYSDVLNTTTAYVILFIVIGIITCVPILASASAAPILLLNNCEYGNAFKKAIKRKS